MIDRAQEKYDEQKKSWSIYLSFIKIYIEWWNKIIIAAFEQLSKDLDENVIEIINDPKKYSECSQEIKDKIKMCHAELFKNVPQDIRDKAKNVIDEVYTVQKWIDMPKKEYLENIYGKINNEHLMSHAIISIAIQTLAEIHLFEAFKFSTKPNADTKEFVTKQTKELDSITSKFVLKFEAEELKQIYIDHISNIMNTVGKNKQDVKKQS